MLCRKNQQHKFLVEITKADLNYNHPGVEVKLPSCICGWKSQADYWSWPYTYKAFLKHIDIKASPFTSEIDEIMKPYLDT